jgi:hypothetical protein
LLGSQESCGCVLEVPFHRKILLKAFDISNWLLVLLLDKLKDKRFELAAGSIVRQIKG